MVKEKKKKSLNNKNKIGLFKLLWGVATTRQKWAFFGLMILGVLAALAILIPTQVISIIVSKLSGETIKILSFVIPNSTSYVTIIVVGGVITLIMRLLKMLYDLLIEKLLKRLVANLRTENFDWLISPRRGMDLKMTQGDALYRLNQAPDMITNVVCGFFEDIIPDIMAAVIAFVYILILDLQSLPILIGGIVMVVICVIVRTKLEKTISFKTEKAKSSMSGMVANSISNLPIINLYKSMNYESNVFSKRVDNYYNEQKKQINLRILYWLFVRIAQVATTFLIIYLCAKRIYAGTMLVGSIVTISNFVAQIFTPIQTIGYFSAMWIQSIVAVERLVELKPKQSELLPTVSNIGEKIESLELIHVCAKNSENFEVKNINAKFVKGELTVISGESGSGKSTLIKLICGLCEKTSGDIVINDSSKLASAYLLVDKMSISMQDAYIFNRDVNLNVLYPDGQTDNESYERVIKSLSIEGVVKRKYNEEAQHNLDTMLSGGEKKRIGISRALIRKADIYVFDEPTNDLDNSNAKKVISEIKKLKDEAIVIVVTHDDRVKAIAEQMLVFADRGKLEKIK